MTEGVEIISFDDKIAPWTGADAVLGHEIEGDEVGIDGPITLDFVGLPNQAESGRVTSVTSIQQAQKLFAT